MTIARAGHDGRERASSGRCLFCTTTMPRPGQAGGRATVGDERHSPSFIGPPRRLPAGKRRIQPPPDTGGSHNCTVLKCASRHCCGRRATTLTIYRQSAFAPAVFSPRSLASVPAPLHPSYDGSRRNAGCRIEIRLFCSLLSKDNVARGVNPAKTQQQTSMHNVTSLYPVRPLGREKASLASVAQRKMSCCCLLQSCRAGRRRAAKVMHSWSRMPPGSRDLARVGMVGITDRKSIFLYRHHHHNQQIA